jgi:ubiquitin carboxyl-terminal hydrolase 22/27/51
MCVVEHIENFHKTGQNVWKTFEQYYIRALHTIRNENPIVPQSLRNGKTLSPSLRPTWLCMQCPFIFSEDARQAHWASPKQHSFCPSTFRIGALLTPIDVESRSGCLYCLNCDDYVFDPHFERLRLNNGSFFGVSAQC